MATVVVRVFLVYMLFICAIRLSGKRQVGELQISELVVTFMVSELATLPIQDISIPISYAVIPIVFLLCFEVIVSFLITKSPFLKKMFSGNPSFLIKNGVLNQKELSKLRIGANELLGELRLKDVASISDVDYAIIEQNGKLSVFLKKDKQTLSLSDINISGTSEGIAHAVVIDGSVDYSNLKLAQKNEAWLKKELSEKKTDIEDIFLMTVDDASNINIIKRKEK